MFRFLNFNLCYHMDSKTVILFAQAFVQAKKKANAPKEVFLSISDKERLSKPGAMWRDKVYWVNQYSEIKFNFKK